MAGNGRHPHSIMVAHHMSCDVLISDRRRSAPSNPRLRSRRRPRARHHPSAHAAQPAKAPEAAPRPAGEGIPALVVDGDQVLGVLGKQVRSSAGEDMGRIVDVIIDRSARVRAAVIDFGGFLGVGNRQIAVAWSAIRLPAQDKPGALVVDFTRDQLRVAPTYKAGEQVVLLGRRRCVRDSERDHRIGEGRTPKEQPTK